MWAPDGVEVLIGNAAVNRSICAAASIHLPRKSPRGTDITGNCPEKLPVPCHN